MTEAKKDKRYAAQIKAMEEKAAAAEESKQDTLNTSGSDDHNKSTGGSSGSGGGASTGNLFAVGESQDKGLADIETGSEVYMSELLVSSFKIFPMVAYISYE